jgi:AraC-like DNA-binding protein
MEVIYLLGAVQAGFFVALIAMKKDRQKSDVILMIWLLCMGLHLLSYYAVADAWYDHKLLGIMILLLPPLIYVHGPFLFIYTDVVTKKSVTWKWSYLLHFIPFALSVANYAWLYLIKAEGDIVYLFNRPYITPWTGMTFYLLNIFLNPIYVILVLIKLRLHQKKIKENFSSLEEVSLNWLRNLALGLGIVSVIVWILHSAMAFGVVTRDFQDEPYVFLFVALFVFFIGFYGFRQGMIYRYLPSGEDRKSEPPERYLRSRLEPNEARYHLARIEEFMQSKKPWLQPRFSLDELSASLQLSPHLISQILNLELKKNFFEYVSQYRVEAFKRNLFIADLQHLSLLGVALESGFNSKSSFNRIFKQSTGLTPSQYKKTLIQQNNEQKNLQRK